MIEYANRYDPWPIHVDEKAAQESPYGGLTASSGYSIGLWYASGNRGIWNHPERPVAMISGIDRRLRHTHGEELLRVAEKTGIPLGITKAFLNGRTPAEDTYKQVIKLLAPGSIRT